MSTPLPPPPAPDELTDALLGAARHVLMRPPSVCIDSAELMDEVTRRMDAITCRRAPTLLDIRCMAQVRRHLDPARANESAPHPEDVVTPWHTDAVQELVVTRRTVSARGGTVLRLDVPRDGDCVGDIEVAPHPGTGPIDVSVEFEGNVVWSGSTGASSRYRLPFGGINIHAARGHSLCLVLAGGVPADVALQPRVTATFRCHEPLAVRRALYDRGPLRDVLIPDW